MSVVFDPSLEGQVTQFLGDVDDLLTLKTGTPVQKLVSLIACDEKPVRENALAFLAFANQAAVNKDASREAGLIPVFLNLLTPATLTLSVSMVKHAVMGLMFLANHSEVNKQAIVDVNGVSIAFDLLRDIKPLLTTPPAGTKKEEVQQVLSHTLNLIILLATLAPVRETMGSVANFLVLAEYIQYENPENAEQQNQTHDRALSCVNNICLHKENKENARVAGCIEAVLKLFKSSKVTIVDSAVRMVYNMTISDTSRETLRRVGGLEALVGLFGEQDAIRVIALKALSNLAVDRQTIEYVVQHKEAVLTPILNLFPLTNNELVFDQVLTIIQNLVSEDAYIEEMSKSGIIEKIVQSIKGMPLANTTQQSILIKSSCIISALVTIEDIQQSSVESGVIASLIDLLKYQSADIKREAARSLANVTPYYDDVRGEVGKLGGVPMLLDLLLGADKEVVRQAARALVNLARNTHNEEAIYEAKGIEHSIRLINKEEKELKMLGTKLLVNLSLNEKARISFCQKGGLSIVLTLLTSPDQELQLQGTKIVTNLAISGRNRKLMAESVPELAPAVQKLTTSTSVDIKTQAEVAFNNMSFPYEKSYEGLDFGLEEHIPTLMTQSQYEHEEEDDDDEDREETKKQRIVEEEELRLAAESEIEERKRIMEEEMKRIDTRRKQEEERRKKEEEIAKAKKEEAEKMRLLEEEMERVRLEEAQAARQAEEARKKAEAEAEKERLRKETELMKENEEKVKAQAALEAQIQKQAAEEEARRVIEEARVKKEEEETRRKKEEAEKERKRVEEEERARLERQEEEVRMRLEEEDRVRMMQLEIKAREEGILKKKEEEEARRKKEEADKRAQELQDAASQAAAKAAQEAARAQKRTHIVQEIVHVESNYVRNLGLMVKKFLNPLVSAAASKRPIIANDKIKALFSIVEIIHNYNSMLSDGLQTRVKRWLADNKTEPLIIGDIFLTATSTFTVYSTYINNYNLSIKTLKELKATNVAFAQFVRKVEADPELRDMELENLLINPVQQLPRYVMLLQDLIKNTTEDHPDLKGLNGALDKIKQVTSYVNERKRDAEDAMTMINIHQNLHGKVPSGFVAPHRKFVKEGSIQFGSSSGSFKDKDPIVFLFNDMVMMTIKHPNKPNEYKFRYSVLLTPLTVVEDFPRINNGFIVKAAQWWMFSCATPQEKTLWVDTITKAISALPKNHWSEVEGANSLNSGNKPRVSHPSRFRKFKYALNIVLCVAPRGIKVKAQCGVNHEFRAFSNTFPPALNGVMTPEEFLQFVNRVNLLVSVSKKPKKFFLLFIPFFGGFIMAAAGLFNGPIWPLVVIGMLITFATIILMGIIGFRYRAIFLRQCSIAMNEANLFFSARHITFSLDHKLSKHYYNNHNNSDHQRRRITKYFIRIQFPAPVMAFQPVMVAPMMQQPGMPYMQPQQQMYQQPPQPYQTYQQMQPMQQMYQQQPQQQYQPQPFVPPPAATAPANNGLNGLDQSLPYLVPTSKTSLI
eukprot:gene14569-17222_t